MEPDGHVVLLHLLSGGLRPSDSPTRSLASRFVGSLRSRGSLRRARSRLTFHLSLQTETDTMESDGHVVFLYLEEPREFFDRQPLDVTQQEQAGVLAVQLGDGAAKPLLQQQRGLDGSVRRRIVVNRVRTKLPAPQHV